MLELGDTGRYKEIWGGRVRVRVRVRARVRVRVRVYPNQGGTLCWSSEIQGDIRRCREI